MSKRLAIGMSAVLSPLIVCLSLMTLTAGPARAGTDIGVTDDEGRFVPKARVVKEHSRIVVSKLRAEEKLGNLEIRFIAGKVEPRFSTGGIFLQWQKSDGPGRLWPLESQKSFDKATGIYRSTWNTSSSFTIMDKSGRGVFEKHPLHRLVEFRVNGKSLLPRKATPSRRAAVTSSPPTMKVESEPDPAPTVPSVVPRVVTRAPEGFNQADPADYYKRKYDLLLKRTRDLERSLDSVRKRSYLQIALFALTGGVVAGAGLFMTFFLPRRRARIGTPAQIGFGKLRLRPAYKTQRAG